MCSGTLAVGVWLPSVVGLVGDDHSHRAKPFGVQMSSSDGVVDALSGCPFFGNDLGDRFTQVISGHYLFLSCCPSVMGWVWDGPWFIIPFQIST